MPTAQELRGSAEEYLRRAREAVCDQQRDELIETACTLVRVAAAIDGGTLVAADIANRPNRTAI
jgi:hypothetical protein